MFCSLSGVVQANMIVAIENILFIITLSLSLSLSLPLSLSLSLSLSLDLPEAVKEIREVRARYMSRKMLKKGGEREISVSERGGGERGTDGQSEGV